MFSSKEGFFTLIVHFRSTGAETEKERSASDTLRELDLIIRQRTLINRLFHFRLFCLLRSM